MPNHIRGSASPTRTPVNEFDVTNTNVGQLTESLVEVANVFDFFKRESPKFQITKYKDDFDSISEVLHKTCIAFIRIAKIAEQESEDGAHTSATVIHLIGKLLDKETPQEKLQDLINDLLQMIDCLKQAAEHLKTEFTAIHESFLWAEAQEISLTAAVNDYRNAGVSWGTKFRAAVTPPINSRTRAFRDAADPKKRATASDLDSNLLLRTRKGLERAIEVTTILVDDWATVYSTIQHASGDFSNTKVALLELQQRRWAGIGGQYRQCASKARAVQSRLRVKDAPKPALQVMAGREPSSG